MKLLRNLTILLLLALPYSLARAEYSGFEGQVSFYETVNGHFSPGMKIQTAMYHEGYAIGAFVGENEAAGLAGIWRVFELDISPDFLIATHLGASSDLWQGSRPEGESDQLNVAYFFEPRIGWSGLNGKVEVGLVVQCLTMDGQEREWTFGVNLNFMPSKLPGGVTATAPSASIQDELATWRAYDMASTGIELDSD